MNRSEILEKAKEIVTTNRQDIHGKAENSFNAIASMWTAYLDQKASRDGVAAIEAHDVAAMMALLKIVRFAYTPSYNDNTVDLAGYAACMGELATQDSFNNLVKQGEGRN